MERVKELIEDQICSELKELKDDELDLDEYKTTVDGITKLTDRLIEIEKLEKEDARKEAEAKESKKREIRKDVITSAGIVTTAGLTVWGTLKSLKFEETGTVTTIMGRGFLNKLLPKH